eukprot:scaffold71444_cov29-Tisochrysis_lutea.AAC.4
MTFWSAHWSTGAPSALSSRSCERWPTGAAVSKYDRNVDESTSDTTRCSLTPSCGSWRSAARKLARTRSGSATPESSTMMWSYWAAAPSLASASLYHILRVLRRDHLRVNVERSDIVDDDAEAESIGVGKEVAECARLARAKEARKQRDWRGRPREALCTQRCESDEKPRHGRTAGRRRVRRGKEAAETTGVCSMVRGQAWAHGGRAQGEEGERRGRGGGGVCEEGGSAAARREQRRSTPKDRRIE